LVIIICEDTCTDCGKNFLKDPTCLGDYTGDGVLLRYCPECGKMYPYLNIVYTKKTGLSKRMKKRIGIRIAKAHNLDYRVMDFLVKSTTGEDKSYFASTLSEKILTTFNMDVRKEEVLNLV
jgi:hypothetical protein